MEEAQDKEEPELGERQPQGPFSPPTPASCGLAGAHPAQVIEKERPHLTECEEPSIYSPAFPREKWQRKRTQVKIRVRALPLATSSLPGIPSPKPLPGPTSSCLSPAPGYHQVSSPPSSPPPPPSQVSDWRSLASPLSASAPGLYCLRPLDPLSAQRTPRTSDRGQQKRPLLGPRPSLGASWPASSRQLAHTSGRGSPSPALPASLSSPGRGLTLSPPARTSPPTTGRATRWCARAAPRC